MEVVFRRISRNRVAAADEYYCWALRRRAVHCLSSLASVVYAICRSSAFVYSWGMTRDELISEVRTAWRLTINISE